MGEKLLCSCAPPPAALEPFYVAAAPVGYGATPVPVADNSLCYFGVVVGVTLFQVFFSTLFTNLKVPVPERVGVPTTTGFQMDFRFVTCDRISGSPKVGRASKVGHPLNLPCVQMLYWARPPYTCFESAQ